MRSGAAAAALLLVLPACSLPPEARRPETWPPRTAEECLTGRPPVGNPIIWPAAVTVRDWAQPVTDGTFTAMFCLSGAPNEPASTTVEVTTTGDVRDATPASIALDRTPGRVVPITARVTERGNGQLTVTIRSLSDSGEVAAAQGMTVWVRTTGSGSAATRVTECVDLARCTWD